MSRQAPCPGSSRASSLDLSSQGGVPCRGLRAGSSGSPAWRRPTVTVRSTQAAANGLPCSNLPIGSLALSVGHPDPGISHGFGSPSPRETPAAASCCWKAAHGRLPDCRVGVVETTQPRVSPLEDGKRFGLSARSLRGRKARSESVGRRQPGGPEVGRREPVEPERMIPEPPAGNAGMG